MRSSGPPTRTQRRDDSANDQFELLVEPGTNPLDVYQHPYAYAAWRGTAYKDTRLQKAA